MQYIHGLVISDDDDEDDGIYGKITVTAPYWPLVESLQLHISPY